jgi:hypothetical protein
MHVMVNHEQPKLELLWTQSDSVRVPIIDTIDSYVMMLYGSMTKGAKILWLNANVTTVSNYSRFYVNVMKPSCNDVMRLLWDMQFK